MKLKDPIEQRRFITLNVTVGAMFVLLPLGGYLLKDLDFAKGTLIGCAVVAVNFFISQRFLGRVIVEKRLPLSMLFMYLGKLGLSGFVIYKAIQYQVDSWGLMFGLSSIFLATMIASLLRGSSSPEENG